MFERDLTIWAEEASWVKNPYLTEWYKLAIENQLPSLAGNYELPSLADNYEEYIKRFREIMDSGRYEGEVRRSLVKKYAWAVPCDKALKILAKLSPLLEIGAGTGYWAHLLRERGVDVLAYDLHPAPSTTNHYHQGSEAWTEVLNGDWRVVKKHPDRTLFLCWPPYDELMAYKCLKAYRGKSVVFVGEDSGGCTGCDRFFGLLESDFELVKAVSIPQFNHIHDAMFVYERT